MINPFKTKLSRKLLLSFAVVSAVPMAVGLIAVVNMRDVSSKTDMLARRYVPEVNTFSRIDDDYGEATYAMRGFQYTGETRYMNEANHAMTDSDLAVAEAEKLAASSTNDKLKTGIADLKRELGSYKQLMAESEAESVKRMEARTKLFAIGGELDAAVDKLIAELLETQKAAIESGAQAKVMLGIRDSLTGLTTLSDLLGKVRIQVWRSYALRDAKEIEKLLSDGMQPLTSALAVVRAGVTQQHQTAELDRIRQLVGAYFDGLKAVRDQDARFDAVNASRVKVAESIRERSRGITESGLRDTLAVAVDANERLALASFVMLVGITVGLLLGTIIAVVISRMLAGPLEYLIEGTSKLAVSASEISSTTSQLASNSMETSASVSEISATVEEVRQTAQVCSDKAQRVSTQADKLTESVEAGRLASKEAIEGMARIKQEMEYIAESIIKLSEQTQNIGEITGAVNDLADQSNLLSVNAAIEAAKAGEYGKGFAVVAQEVKNLADQSKEATNQIKAILNDIQKATGTAVMATERGTKAVDAGAALSTQASSTIGVLLENVKQGASATQLIAASSQQQLAGMDQLVMAMRSIKDAATQNVSGTKQLEQAAQNLNELGGKLKEISRTYST